VTFSISRPSKIYPNWDFWFENIPSGNPAEMPSHSKESLAHKAGHCRVVTDGKIKTVSIILPSGTTRLG
jgi:hypothetical protein